MRKEGYLATATILGIAAPLFCIANTAYDIISGSLHIYSGPMNGGDGWEVMDSNSRYNYWYGGSSESLTFVEGKVGINAWASKDGIDYSEYIKHGEVNLDTPVFVGSVCYGVDEKTGLPHIEKCP